MNKLEIENKLKNNKLPEGWVKVKLGSLLIEPKERNITNKKLLVFSISNVKGFVLQDEYFSHNIHSKKTTNYKVFRENYFGYNPARINVGSIALSEKQREGLLSPMYVIFKTKSTLNPKYLKYFIQTSHFKNNVINNVAGSVRESLNYSSLEMFDFIYPISISEQKRIAEILETVDETIDETSAIIEKYKRIKQGLMQDLLTRGIDENGQIRSEKTHRFKDSPLGRIPEEWKIEKDFIKIFSGYGFALKEYSEFGIQLIRIDNVGYGKLNHENFAYLPYSYVKTFNRFLIKKDDIILALNRPITQKKLKIAKVDIDRGILYQRVGLLIFRNKIEKEFYYYYLQSDLFVNQLELLLVGSDQPYITNYNFKDIVFKIPPLTEQHRIAGVLSQIDETIEKEQKYKQKLERLKQGLMEDLLTGKVRVLNVN